MTKIPEISIVVPVFNSEFILSTLVARVKETFSKHPLSFELILVDDCSSDNSWQKIKDLQEKFAFVQGFRNEQNQGQAYTSIRGLAMASGKYLSTIDDDLEYNPEEILDLYSLLLAKNVDVVFGIAPNKYELQGKNAFFAKLRNKVLNLLWQKPLTDSFKIFKRNLIFDKEECMLNVPFEVYLKKKKKEVKIAYHKVGYNKRFQGKSNYTLWKKIRLFFEMSQL